MRTLRLSLAGTVILVLLGGVCAVVTAQEEPSLDPMRASQFTGTWTDGPSDDVGFEWAPGPGYSESVDNESVHLFEASDPRISGTYEGVIIPGSAPDQPAPIEAVAPEPPAPGGNTWVTGTVTCDVTQDFTSTVVEGVEQKRGEVRQCVWASSDPRISGPVSVYQDADCHPLVTADWVPACLWWGTLEAPDWTGSLITTTYPSGRFLAQTVMTGRTANAGLAFVGTNTPEGWSGHLYEGDAPPSAPLPSPANE